MDVSDIGKCFFSQFNGLIYIKKTKSTIIVIWESEIGLETTIFS